MWLKLGMVAALVACVGQSWGRSLNLIPRPIQPIFKAYEVKRLQYPHIPDYVFKNILDYEPNAQEKLLQDHQDPEVTPGFYQGDMAGLGPNYQAHIRVGLKWEVFPERKWQNGTVPYVISHLYRPHEWNVIDTAIATLNFLTCINFVPWDGTVNDYLLIWPMKSPAG
ncbi:hypothetical protein SK128_027725 [Halocaridina rubra]|uniref:Peptidase M12A domain-containing protein n=1 Tax=Halocaridina rubra TaxID=373956 RepID=A0AAN8XAM0_HALRR